MWQMSFPIQLKILSYVLLREKKKRVMIALFEVVQLLAFNLFEIIWLLEKT